MARKDVIEEIQSTARIKEPGYKTLRSKKKRKEKKGSKKKGRSSHRAKHDMHKDTENTTHCWQTTTQELRQYHRNLPTLNRKKKVQHRSQGGVTGSWKGDSTAI